MDFFHGFGTSIFEVPGFMKLVCVKMKLRPHQNAPGIGTDAHVAMALAHLRRANIMASRLKGPSGDLDAVVAFDSDHTRLRRCLHAFERHTPDLVLDLGRGLCLEYTSVNILDFASPDFESALSLSSQPCDYFWALLSLLEAIEEKVRQSFLETGQFIRVSFRILKARSKLASYLRVRVAFSSSGSLQIRLCCTSYLFHSPRRSSLRGSGEAFAFLTPTGIVAKTLSLASRAAANQELIAQRSLARTWLSEKGRAKVDPADNDSWADVSLNIQRPLGVVNDLDQDGNCFLSWPKAFIIPLESLLSISHEVESTTLSSGSPKTTKDDLRWMCDWQRQRPPEADFAVRTPAQELASLSVIDSDLNAKQDKASPNASMKEMADSQNAHALYPTPSDGPATQATPASIPMEGIQAVETSGPSRVASNEMEHLKTLAEEEADSATSPHKASQPSAHTDHDAEDAEDVMDDDFDVFNEGDDADLLVKNDLDTDQSANATKGVDTERPETDYPMIDHSQQMPTELPALTKSSSLLTPNMIKERLSQTSRQQTSQDTHHMVKFGMDHLSGSNVIGSSDLKYASNSRFDFAIEKTPLKSDKPKATHDVLGSHLISSPNDLQSDSGARESQSESESNISYSEDSDEDLESLSDSDYPPPAIKEQSVNASASIYSHVRPPNAATAADRDPPTREILRKALVKTRFLLEQCYRKFNASLLGARILQFDVSRFEISLTGDDAQDESWSAVVQDIATQSMFSSDERADQSYLAQINHQISWNDLQAGLRRTEFSAKQRHLCSLPTALDIEGDPIFHMPDLSSLDGQVILQDKFTALPLPMIRIQRNQSSWDMLPTAVDFWDTLGLAPTNGPKDVNIFAISPAGQRFEDAARSLLEQVKASYLSHRLGIARIGSSDHSEGVVFSAAPENGEESTQALACLDSACKQLSSQLVTAKRGVTRAMIFILDPLETPESITSLCRTCHDLREGVYKTAPDDGRQVPAEIGFRILNMSTLVNSDLPLLLPEAFASKMVRQVYGQFRIPDDMRTDTDLCIRAAPCVELTPPLPPKIPFELTAEPPEHLMLQDSCLHVAYAMDPQRAWLAAAWIDNTGQHLFKSTYSIQGRKFEDVANVVWQTTADFISTRHVRWHIFIAKAAALSREEQWVWLQCLKQHAIEDVSVSLIAASLQPDFHISPRLMPPHMAESTLAAHDTPMADAYTPSSSGQVSSAGPPTAASTPSAMPHEGDPSARLTNPVDESWALIFHEPYIVFADEDTAPAPLSSGLLLKRVSASEKDPPVFLQADLLWTNEGAFKGADPPVNMRKRHDALLKNVLAAWRGLALLARIWDVETERSTTPWHLAVAERCVNSVAATVTL